MISTLLLSLHYCNTYTIYLIPTNYMVPFLQKDFHGGPNFLGQINEGFVLHRRSNNQIMPRMGEFYKCNSPAMVRYSIEDKTLTILKNYGRIYP